MSRFIHHRDTETTEVTQRRSQTKTLPSVNSLLRSGFEMKQGNGNGELLVIVEVHEDGDHTAVIGGDAAIVTEEYFRVASEWRHIDLVINE